MNILYLAHRLPYPPDKGCRIRAYHELRYLSERHDVSCACFSDEPGAARHIEALRAFCDRVAVVRASRPFGLIRGAVGLMRGRSITSSAYPARRMNRVLARWVSDRPFDAVVAFSSAMAPYAFNVGVGRVILDFCDLDSLKWRDYARRSSGPIRWLYATEARRLAAFERHWLAQSDCTIFITPDEARGLVPDDPRDIGPNKARGPLPADLRGKIRVMPNGVSIPTDVPPDPPPEAVPVIGFVGDMRYRPNIEGVEWFTRRCLPAIRNACPDAEFHVVGRGPTRRVRALALLPGVRIIGAVADVSPHLRRFHVSVAPLHVARGLQNKVLEAMAHARPSVVTRRAACGIGANDGVHWFIADDAPAFQSAVVRLLTDITTAHRMGQAARRFVAERFRWETALSPLDAWVTGEMTGSTTDLVTPDPQPPGPPSPPAVGDGRFVVPQAPSLPASPP